MNQINTTTTRLSECLKQLHLPSFRDSYQEIADTAQQESFSYQQYLLELSERECDGRYQRRVDRLLRQSCLPLEKTIETFNMKRLSPNLLHKTQRLLEGSFVDNKENVLAFGNPGSGKTHLLCAIGHALIQQNRQVYFSPCSLLVQKLLAAKRDIKLDRLLKKLDKYEAIIIDDIGYVQQSRQEMEVLFTLLAQRYERGSVMLTSNLPFSKWETIFKDPMTTAAAIDRLVHHSVILELNLSSYRLEQAKNRTYKKINRKGKKQKKKT